MELFEPQPNNSIYMKSPLAKNLYGRLFGNIRHSRSSYIQNEFFLSRSFLKFDDDIGGGGGGVGGGGSVGGNDGDPSTRLNGMQTAAVFGSMSPTYHSGGKVEPAQYIFKGKMSRKMCGDWNAKLKLLRYVTQGTVLGIHFVSDYSHHFSGYKARITMESGKS